MSIAEPISVSDGLSVSNTGWAGEHISLPLTSAQRRLSLEAIRVFSRRSAYAYETGALTRALPVPFLDGKILRVPNDPETVKMFVVSLRIPLLRDHHNGPTQAAEGLVHRLTRKAIGTMIPVRA